MTRMAGAGESVTSADGTVIGYRRMGAGPGLVVVHGSLRSGDDYTRLGGYLADSFTVYLVDRRGRGASGPQGPDYSFRKEREDLTAVLRATGAAMAFGHSFGGAVCLETALEHPLSKLAVYEPAVAADGVLQPDVLQTFTDALDSGKPGRALAAVFGMAGDQDARIPGPLRAVLSVPLLARALFATPPGRRLRGLLATMPAEGRLVRETDGSYDRFSRITTPTLLMRGTRSANWLLRATTVLNETIPHAATAVLDGIGHNGPCEDAPGKVADVLREFLMGPASARPGRS